MQSCSSVACDRSSIARNSSRDILRSGACGSPLFTCSKTVAMPTAKSRRRPLRGVQGASLGPIPRYLQQREGASQRKVTAN